jgi:phosphoglycerol transferase
MDRARDAYLRDRDFVRSIEERVPAGKVILQMPYRVFPEPPLEPPGIAFEPYELLRPAIHSRTLRWTYGSIHGSESDRWQARLNALPLDQQLETIADAELGGVTVDCNAYADRGQSLLKDLERRLGPPSVVSGDSRMVFFDLASYVDERRSRIPPEEWASRRDRALHPLLVCWRTGFQGEERAPDTGWVYRWSDRSSMVMVVNELNIPREARLSMKFDVPYQEKEYRLRVKSGFIENEVTLSKEPRAVEQIVTVPPGKHLIRFDCDGPRLHRFGLPGHPVVFRTLQCEIEEIPAARPQWSCKGASP